MPRPRKNPLANLGSNVPANIAAWAETLGEALGRGVARGINAGLGGLTNGVPAVGQKRRGRPPKYLTAGNVPAERRCSESGCQNPARSKGLCSKHYQAQRREEHKKQS